MELGDNFRYVVKGVGSVLFQLEFRDSIHMRDVLYILGLKKNLLSISTLENRGYKVTFIDVRFLYGLRA